MATCIRCGAEIREGVYNCPVCGFEVQLVPNYESLDLEMMLRRNTSDAQRVEELQERREVRRKELNKQKMIKRLLTIAIIAVAAIGILIAVANIRSTMVNSGDAYDTAYADALKMYEEGDYQNAYNAVNEALGYKEDSEEALILKAQIAYFGLDGEDEAVSILKKLIANDPTSETAYKALLEIYADAGEYDMVAEVMNDASDDIRQKLADYVVGTPTFSPGEGRWNTDIDVTLTADEGYQIFYTTDEEAEFESYIEYTQPIHVTQGTTVIYAVSVNSAGIHSKTVSGSFEVVYDAPDAPVFATASGAYSGSNNKVEIGAVEGCTVYYAVDEKPSMASTVYTGAFEMLEGKHFVYAFAVNEKGTGSRLSAIWYEYTPTKAETNNTQNNRNYSYNSDDYYWSGGNSGGSSGSDYSGGDSTYVDPTTEPTEQPTPEPDPTTEPTQEPTPEPDPTEEPTIEPEPEAANSPDAVSE